MHSEATPVTLNLFQGPFCLPRKGMGSKPKGTARSIHCGLRRIKSSPVRGGGPRSGGGVAGLCFG